MPTFECHSVRFHYTLFGLKYFVHSHAVAIMYIQIIIIQKYIYDFKYKKRTFDNKIIILFYVYLKNKIYLSTIF